MIRNRTFSAIGAAAGAVVLGLAMAPPAMANTQTVSFSCDGGYGNGSATLETYGAGGDFMLTTTVTAPADVPSGLSVTLTTSNGSYVGSTIAVLEDEVLLFEDFSGSSSVTSTDIRDATPGPADTLVIDVPPAAGVPDVTCTVTSDATLTWP
ncbi:hypothetical protein [Yinghuangia sp. YIM S09857]|uniref:hypothetical protein n=1 Tax=Yinghuangia sp. YIM S09857 TaxID=3436929 RepID=UPI003F534AE2